MKQHILPALRFTAVCVVVFAGIYAMLILCIAQAAPNKGLGQTVIVNGKVRGYALEGQGFTQDKYLNGRPSGRHIFGAQSIRKKEELPSELVTASDSGLDPDISPEAALVQVDRISKERKLSVDQLKTFVQKNIQQPFAGVFHTPRSTCYG